MGGTRDFNFNVGPETATLPTASSPTEDVHFVTKGYADATYAPAGSVAPAPHYFKLVGQVATTYTDFDNHFTPEDSGSVTHVRVTCSNSGTGTTTATIYREGPSGSTSFTASITGDGALKSTKTDISDVSFQEGDIFYCDITTIGVGVVNVTVKLINSN